jgi:hypothetical protein
MIPVLLILSRPVGIAAGRVTKPVAIRCHNGNAPFRQ